MKCVGEPLQADFEKFGLECNAELDTAYPFVIPCYDTTEYTTAGKSRFQITMYLNLMKPMKL